MNAAAVALGAAERGILLAGDSYAGKSSIAAALHPQSAPGGAPARWDSERSTSSSADRQRCRVPSPGQDLTRRRAADGTLQGRAPGAPARRLAGHRDHLARVGMGRPGRLERRATSELLGGTDGCGNS